MYIQIGHRLLEMKIKLENAQYGRKLCTENASLHKSDI